MNHCAIQQNTFSTREEMRSPVSLSDRRDSMVCPKPRRVGLHNTNINDNPIRSLRWQLSYQTELCDSIAGNTDYLDIILTKGGYCMEQTCTQLASSPPFFCGSPPSRVANPLIQDARFTDEMMTPPMSPLTPVLPQSGMSSPSSARKGGCVRASYGSKPAVRVEGFDCLNRDRRHCGIPTLA